MIRPKWGRAEVLIVGAAPQPGAYEWRHDSNARLTYASNVPEKIHRREVSLNATSDVSDESNMRGKGHYGVDVRARRLSRHSQESSSSSSSPYSSDSRSLSPFVYSTETSRE